MSGAPQPEVGDHYAGPIEVVERVVETNVNRQLYENSPIRGSSEEEAFEGREDGLYNPTKPDFGILHEKPEHRLIILLKSQGHSNTEIARLTGYTIPWVGQILRQPWARNRVLEEINKAGRENVSALLESSAVDSVYTIIDLRDKADDEGVRLRASQDLLDRYLGKATQKVESKSEVKHLSGDIAEVDAELNRVQEELNRLHPSVAARN